MTCWVEVMAPDGSVMQARALLHCAASTSLIMERLINKLCLPWSCSSLKINRVAGFNARPRGIVSFKVAGVRSGGNRLRWKPLSFPRSWTTYPQFLFPQLPGGSTSLTSSLPTPIMEYQQEWTSYLGESFFSKTILYGRWFSPTTAQLAFKTCFGWVLNGEANGESQQCSSHNCGVSLNSDSKGIDKQLAGKSVP